VIEGLVAAHVDAVISIDTSKLEVARAALDAGATFVNDVTAFRGAPEMAALVAARGAECALTHMQGEPRTMQQEPRYGDVVAEVRAFLAERVQVALAAGIERERIVVDPGIGFGKTVAHNIELLDRLGELRVLGQPILIGTSRKSFLGALTGRHERDRLAATIATNVIALLRGASVFRVHDVGAVHDALEVAAATVSGR
jgi:dihydropteroate synthase